MDKETKKQLLEILVIMELMTKNKEILSLIRKLMDKIRKE